MDIRVLRYFLAVAREQSFSIAAERLYVSQPTLSRQLKELEEELGKQLFIRGGKKLLLTEEGMILRKRAGEILELVEKTEQEVRQSDELISGTVYIGAGETPAITIAADAARKLREEYPDIRISVFSGDAQTVLEKLDRGLIDFGIVFLNTDETKYGSIVMPIKDRWGVLMRKDSELAQKERITVSDLKDKPLILPRQQNHAESFLKLIGIESDEKNFAMECNLINNAAVMVRCGVGYAVTLDNLINVTGESDLRFIPLYPPQEISCSFIWKKYTIFSKAAEKFFEVFKSELENYPSPLEK